MECSFCIHFYRKPGDIFGIKFNPLSPKSVNKFEEICLQRCVAIFQIKYTNITGWKQVKTKVWYLIKRQCFNWLCDRLCPITLCGFGLGWLDLRLVDILTEYLAGQTLLYLFAVCRVVSLKQASPISYNPEMNKIEIKIML